MGLPWLLSIYEGRTLVHTEDLCESLELGRQSDGEDGPFCKRKVGAVTRLIVAGREEKSISRAHALLEPLEGDRLRITNRSGSRSLRLAWGKELKPGAVAEEVLPLALTLGKRTVHVHPGAGEDVTVQSLAEIPALPGTGYSNFVRPPSLAILPDSTAGNRELVRWLQATMDVFQSAASAADFLLRAAQAVVEITGMEAAHVLLLDDDNQWQTRAEFIEAGRQPARDWQPIRTILSRVLHDKRTFWQQPETVSGKSNGGTVPAPLAVVAAPILDRQGKVMGALYGERRCDGSASGGGGPTTELEAMLVELLASGIATGLARLDQEQAALSARVRFEQFFTPEFSRQLTEQPDLLAGRDCEVSILFADIRGFSRISEQLGPARTFEWISAMLSAMSDCVRQHNGVLVDYIGDELMAMWGAPETQTDHARLACQAALDMIEKLPELNARWQPVVNEPIRFNIGINTGQARVGNTGSRHKFKYGPLGNTVNLARRVQGATKYLHTNLLVTGATIAKLADDFPRRRLCTVRVVNIARPVELYELMFPGGQEIAELRQGYEEALLAFQSRDHCSTACILGNLLKRFPDDGPSLVLLGRTVDAMLDKKSEADFVWELPGK